MENPLNSTIGHWEIYKKISLFLVLLLLFMVFLNVLIQSLDLGPALYQEYVAQEKNLFFVAFFFGIMATAIVQSSSAITTLAVALVAKGDLPLTHAIPIVIGSNIGTTITPFIFSFVHSDKRGQYKRALGVAFAHNLFNVLTAILIIFFEFQFNILSHLSAWFGQATYSSLGSKQLTPIFHDDFLAPIAQYIVHFIHIKLLSATLGFIGMYMSIKGFVALFTHSEIKKDNSYMNKLLFDNSYKTFFTGLLGTALVHSSSATISILQTVSSTYKLNARKTFNFILGANIGTTFTALLAGLFNTEMALELAFAHFLFNLLGAIILGSLPWFKDLNIALADRMATYFEKYRASLIIYVSLLFFVIPLLLIYIF